MKLAIPLKLVIVIPIKLVIPLKLVIKESFTYYVKSPRGRGFRNDYAVIFALSYAEFYYGRGSRGGGLECRNRPKVIT